MGIGIWDVLFLCMYKGFSFLSHLRNDKCWLMNGFFHLLG